METVKGPDSPEKKLERMVELYQLPLLRLCYAYLHDEELAKDAVHRICSRKQKSGLRKKMRP